MKDKYTALIDNIKNNMNNNDLLKDFIIDK